MTWFFARIELHGASSHTKIPALHVEMKKQGFTQTIPLGHPGVLHHLLPGEYSIALSDDTDVSVVSARVSSALTACGPHKIAVTYQIIKSSGSTFSNLDPV